MNFTLDKAAPVNQPVFIGMRIDATGNVCIYAEGANGTTADLFWILINGRMLPIANRKNLLALGFEVDGSGCVAFD